MSKPTKPLAALLRGSNLLAIEPTPPAENVALPRRNFMRGAALGAAALGGLALSACGGGSDSGPNVEFRQGVASGDPQPDRVILWTRATTDAASVTLDWEVASDAAFASVVARGTVPTSSASDFTAKVDATGLQANTAYFYRFRAGANTSPVGRTRTLPTGTISRVRLAVFSCSNYPAGFFNVYAEAARRNDFDATVHLGDYLYEYARGQYASATAAALGREVLPPNEIVSLSDYRARYAQYRSDADLQALHAAAPMIAVWDDHEFTNDTWRDGAENHQSATEGSFAARRAAALQAHHEWMPTRVASPEIIYRSFNFGNLVSLHMLDTRLIGRDLQLDYADFTTPTGVNAAGFAAAVGNPARQLLGTTQTAWLQQQLTASSATWQILGQQVLMGRMNIPAPILFEALSPGSGVSIAQYSAIATKAQTAPATLTPQEQAILAQPAIPYNLDAWDGYAAARETVLGTARALNRNLVVLAGDTHNAWASDLADLSGNQVGVEFAVSSVSSPGFETIFTTENPAVLAASLEQLIGPLQYTDTARRGYMLVTATPTECRCDWVYVNTVASRTYTAVSDRALRTLPGTGNRRIVAV